VAFRAWVPAALVVGYDRHGSFSGCRCVGSRTRPAGLARHSFGMHTVLSSSLAHVGGEGFLR